MTFYRQAIKQIRKQTRSVLNAIMNEVDPISVSNYISYQGFAKAINEATEESVNDVIITFPEIQTITVAIK